MRRAWNDNELALSSQLCRNTASLVFTSVSERLFFACLSDATRSGGVRTLLRAPPEQETLVTSYLCTKAGTAFGLTEHKT
jgi:hypothetical protein